jgi:hypothetical protein
MKIVRKLCWPVWEFAGTNPWALSAKVCAINSAVTVRCCATSWSCWFAVSSEDNCGEMLFHCMTVAVCTVETLQLLHSEVLEHIPYSPDLDPLLFLLFEPLRDALRSHHFVSNHELRKCLCIVPSGQKRPSPPNCTHKPVECWAKCTKNHGE